MEPPEQGSLHRHQQVENPDTESNRGGNQVGEADDWEVEYSPGLADGPRDDCEVAAGKGRYARQAGLEVGSDVEADDQKRNAAADPEGLGAEDRGQYRAAALRGQQQRDLGHWKGQSFRLHPVTAQSDHQAKAEEEEGGEQTEPPQQGTEPCIQWHSTLGVRREPFEVRQQCFFVGGNRPFREVGLRELSPPVFAGSTVVRGRYDGKNEADQEHRQPAGRQSHDGNGYQIAAPEPSPGDPLGEGVAEHQEDERKARRRSESRTR